MSYVLVVVMYCRFFNINHYMPGVLIRDNAGQEKERKGNRKGAIPEGKRVRSVSLKMGCCCHSVAVVVVVVVAVVVSKTVLSAAWNFCWPCC